MKVTAVVLAGGLGVRLWPRSTEKQPKQFIHVMGEGTLIQNTVMRLLPFLSMDQIHIATTRELAPHVADQLPSIRSSNVIQEPFGRNTGPSIALAALTLKHKVGSDNVVIFLPSDHVIQNVREFQVTLDLACTAAEASDSIVTIGVMPTRSETGYGYIQVVDTVPLENPLLHDKIHKVKTFAEKPDLATAQRFIDAGDFVWNSGIFVAKVSTILHAIERHLPDHAPLFNLLEKHVGHEDYPLMVENIFRQMRSVSFDIGVMEKANNVIMVDGAFGWSDVGTWDELYRLSMKDGKNNVIEGNVVTLNTTSCMVSGTSGRLIGIVGTENLIVIDTDQALMICERGRTEQVRDLVELLRRRHIGQSL
jgi:mannose-1-phosphate guanylyltransferase